MKKILKYLSWTVPLLAALGIIFISMLICIGVYYQTYISTAILCLIKYKPKDIDLFSLLEYIPEPPDKFIDLVSYIGPVLWGVVFSLWYRNLTKKDLVYKIKFLTIKNIITLILVGIGCQLITGGLIELILPYFKYLSEEYNELMNDLFTGNPVLVFISVVIVAPISEELVFRGVLLKKILQISPFIVANIIQAMLFSIFHMNIVQGVYAFVGGLVLGFVTYQYNTVKASIIVHMCFNIYDYVILIPAEGYWKFVEILMGIVILIFALRLVKKAGIHRRITALPMNNKSDIAISNNRSNE